LLHSPMVLLHQIVQLLAGSNRDATRKFAAFREPLYKSRPSSTIRRPMLETYPRASSLRL
jgi:hypothetical protein